MNPKTNIIYDVIVIGSGPGGAVAAKKCAEYGLKTLIVEKKKLPREKVCSGILFSDLAKQFVQTEFGVVPDEIIVKTLSGIILWVPEVGHRKIDSLMPIGWRKNIDYWMIKKACAAGVELWERAKLKNIFQNGNECLVKIENDDEMHQLRAKYVIGADGSSSTTRKSVFPDIKVSFRTAVRECYADWLKLDDNYAYIVYPFQNLYANFYINPKGDCYTLEGRITKTKDSIRKLLGPYGFNEGKLLWKDGCMARALLTEYLFNGSFKPAKEKTLLVGDAAGLKIPLSGEGINTALLTGVLAADSIKEALLTDKSVSVIYLEKLAILLDSLRGMYAELNQLEKDAQKGPAYFINALAEAYHKSIHSQCLVDVVEKSV